MSIYPTVNVYDIRFGYWSQQFEKDAQNYRQEDRHKMYPSYSKFLKQYKYLLSRVISNPTLLNHNQSNKMSKRSELNSFCFYRCNQPSGDYITSNVWLQHYCKHGPQGMESFPHFLELFHPHRTEVVPGRTQIDCWHKPDVFLQN